VHQLTKSTSCLTCDAGQQKLRATWHLDLSCRPCLKDKNRGSPGSYCEILAQATEYQQQEHIIMNSCAADQSRITNRSNILIINLNQIFL